MENGKIVRVEENKAYANVYHYTDVPDDTELVETVIHQEHTRRVIIQYVDKVEEYGRSETFKSLATHLEENCFATEATRLQKVQKRFTKYLSSQKDQP